MKLGDQDKSWASHKFARVATQTLRLCGLKSSWFGDSPRITMTIDCYFCMALLVKLESAQEEIRALPQY